MGYSISTLKNLPTCLNCYFFLIGDYGNSTVINNFFREDFAIIASRIGENAGIINQTRKSTLDEELTTALNNTINSQTDVCNFIKSVEGQYPGLLILDKHPSQLTEKDSIVYIPFSTLNAIYINTDDLLTDLVEYAKGNKQLVEKSKKWSKKNKQKIFKNLSVSIGVNIGIITINITL
jgi:hypothetical protein